MEKLKTETPLDYELNLYDCNYQSFVDLLKLKAWVDESIELGATEFSVSKYCSSDYELDDFTLTPIVVEYESDEDYNKRVEEDRKELERLNKQYELRKQREAERKLAEEKELYLKLKDKYENQ